MFGFGFTPPVNSGRHLRRKFRVRLGISPYHRFCSSSRCDFSFELIETLELVAAERTCDAVACELDWWTLVGRLAALAGRWACRPLKFVLGTVIVIYVKGWVERCVLPVLRFFSEIPW